ncbi:MAG TPA: hypothetical protein DDW54_03560, partial [Clostridiales bacterium]|nr:hypothetical protein [Clostridiales bacterium]
MKKTIVKTAIITFLILFVVSALVTVSVGAIRPALLGKFCSDLGIKNAAAFLYERQYDRTGDISDLKILVNASVAAGSEEKVAKYSYSLVADENLKFRETVKDGSEYRYYSFIAVESNYNVSAYGKSVDIAENYGYEKTTY